MKKGNRLLLPLVAAIILSNTPVQAETHKKQTLFQKKFKHTRAEVKKMWFCLNNQNKCSKKEVAKAKRWFIGAPTAVIVATLAAIGVAVTAYMVHNRQTDIVNQEQINMGKNTLYQSDIQNEEELQQTLNDLNKNNKERLCQKINNYLNKQKEEFFTILNRVDPTNKYIEHSCALYHEHKTKEKFK